MEGLMESERKGLSLEQMRAKRNVAEAVFKKFTEAKDKFDTYAFCFFEGEDGKYYNSRIEKYWGSNFIPLVAGKKKEVLKVMRMIKASTLYNNVCTMFFVDRDYDQSLKGIDKDLFETPCYSIENLYAQEATFCRILQAEFGLSVIDSDFCKCLDTYRSRLAEFNQIIFHFNAIVKYQHQCEPDSICQFSSISTSHLAHVSVDKVVKSTHHDRVIAKLLEQLHVIPEKLSQIEENLAQEPQPDLVLRGKNQLDFMVSLIKILKDLNAQGGYFSSKLTRVYITISENRLSELSQYAVTPPELAEFLDAHRPQGAA